MKQLEYNAPDYFIEGVEVIPTLVGGPVGFSYEFQEGQDPNQVLMNALEKITAEAITKWDLWRVPDAYLFTGLTVKEEELIVADGTVPARNMRHGSLLFFRTEPVSVGEMS
jgi:hypothetical protein